MQNHMSEVNNRYLQPIRAEPGALKEATAESFGQMLRRNALGQGESAGVEVVVNLACNRFGNRPRNKIR